MAILLWLSLCLSAAAHQVVLSDDDGHTLLVIRLLPEWTVLASQDGLELASPNSRTRLHCLELKSAKDVEEAKVFLRTLRDTLYQRYDEISSESTELSGQPAMRFRASGISRGLPTEQDAIIFKAKTGTFCLILLQQDVGYEGKLPALTDLVTAP